MLQLHMDDIQSVWEQYPFDEPCRLLGGDSGMNNITRMASCGNDRYVIRIYNNYGNAAAVDLEHEMLLHLGGGESLPFRTPQPVRNSEGATFTALPGGKLAAIFRYIEGERPSAERPGHAAALGEAAGRLSKALADVRLKSKPQYSPYYELASTYAAMDKATFLSLCHRSAALAGKRDALIRIQEDRESAERLCGEVAKLPRQWIHGDLVFNNSLCAGNTIVGVLDFEFVTVDCRAMELAVIAADLLKPGFAGAGTAIAEVCKGFGRIVALTKEERELLPVLMKLRMLDVTLHFAIRYVEGLDSAEVLDGILDSAMHGLDWLERDKPAF